MSYRPSFSPLFEASAVLVSSIKAGATGALIISFYFAFAIFLPIDTVDFKIGSFIATFLFVLIIAFIVGTVATAFSLMTFGLAIARMARRVLASSDGIVISLFAALAVTGVLCLFVQNVFFALLALPYAIPAALFYRHDILAETSFD